MTQSTKNRRAVPTAITVAFIMAGLSPLASAELARLGPVDTTNGYPQWFQDSTGLALDLCMPDAIDLEQGNCLLLPPDVPNGTAPETFPSNFADEHFWFAVGSGLATNGGKATLTLAVEGAFAGGPPKAGDQIVFGRIRVVITNLPAAGTYKVIHPYGELVFPDQAKGDKIFYTDDVGVSCAPGDFSCALKTGIGPFLRASATPGGPALDLVQVNGKTMINDPLVPTFVTGGPFSNKFRIEGPDIGGPGVNVLETETFDLMGRVHTAPIPSPLRAERAAYTRNGSGGWIDVFASAAAGIGKPVPNLTLSGHGVVPKIMSPDGKGMFWGQTNVTSADIPSLVQVTNTSDVPPTVIDVTVSDEVTVTEAAYDPKARRLTVKARSTDDGPLPPKLFLPEFGGFSCDNVIGAVIDNLPVPPKEVTVRSSYGGAATVPVTTLQAAPVAFVLSDLSQSGDEDQMMIFSLAPAGGLPQGSVFNILSQPAHGLLTVDAAGNASYMPAPNYEGSDSFTFVIVDTNGNPSNVSTVSLTVYPVNDAPVANPDSGTTTQNKSLTINLLANDVDPDITTGIDPSTTRVVTPPALGGVSISNGVATYNPDSSVAGAGLFTFTYEVADYAGVWSAPATVTVTVQAIENLQVTAAEYRSDKKRWKVDGNSSVQAGQTVTVRPYNSLTRAEGTVIGTTVVGAGGLWTVDVVGSTVSAAGYNQVKATSPLGGVGTLNLRAK